MISIHRVSIGVAVLSLALFGAGCATQPKNTVETSLIYPGAQTQSNAVKEMNQFSITLTTNDTPTQVFAWYGAQTKAEGWGPPSGEPFVSVGQEMRTYKKDGWELTLSVGPNPGAELGEQSTLILLVEVPKNN